jgi:pilus assembly protein CpaE
MNILWDPDPGALERYRFALGANTQHLDSAAMVARALHDNLGIEQVIIGPDVLIEQACDLSEAARLDRPELGVILLRHRMDVTTLSQALRSGVREVVPSTDETALVDALRRSRELTARLNGHAGASASGRTDGKVITVFSAKGGVGKTTLATNAAVHLARNEQKTLLIDLDLSFGDVAISLQIVPERSIYDAVAMGGNVDEDALRSLATSHEPSGLDVICAPNDPGDADRIPVSVITEMIRVARRHYDYIIVDTPPSFTEHVLAAIDLSDALLLIATLDIPAVKNLRVALETLDALGTPKDNRVVVLNRSELKVGLRPEDVVSAIKVPIAVSIPNSMSVTASINRGVPIVIEEPKGSVSLAIEEMTDEHIRRRLGEDLPEAPHRKGLFSRSSR